MKKIISFLCVLLLLTGCWSFDSKGIVYDYSSEDTPKKTIEQIINDTKSEIDGYSSYGYDLLDDRLKCTYNDILTSALSFDTAVITPTVTAEEISKALMYICHDFPSLSWLSRSYKYGNDSLSKTRITLTLTKKKEQAQKELYDIKQAADMIISDFSNELSDFDKGVLCYDAVISTVKYDDKADYQRELYGALVLKKASCEGYTRAYQYLLCKMGIECLSVYGEAKGPHAWNIVQIDGNYYNADTTWGDGVLEDGREYISHEYLLLDDADFKRSHTPYESDDNYTLPMCDDKAGTFVSKNELVVYTNTKDELEQKLKTALELSLAQDNMAIQISFDKDEIGAQVNTALSDGVTDSIMRELCEKKQCGKIIGRFYEQSTRMLTYIREKT